MKKIILVFIIVFLILFIQLLPKNSKQKYITVFMASSTTDLIEELSDLYTSKTGIIVKSNPASSGILAKQISNGANVDIYISASKKWVDYLDDQTIQKDFFITNSLVLISPVKNPVKFSIGQNLPNVFTGKLSIADPGHVPAGIYAKEVLKFYGWYDTLNPRLLLASNVRAALSIVELGETNLGIVYKTDALKSKKVLIVETFPEKSHNKIEYYLGLLNSKKESKDFYNFLLNSKEAKTIYNKYGFN